MFAEELRVQSNVGVVYRSLGRYDEARAHLSQAAGQHTEAVALHEEVLEIARRTGARQAEAEALNNLGRTLRVQGDPSRALRLHHESAAICAEQGIQYECAKAHDAIANALVALR